MQIRQSQAPDLIPDRVAWSGGAARALWLSLGCWSLLQSGCGKSEEIKRYTVDKPHVLKRINSVEPQERRQTGTPSASVPTRTLAAIVPMGKQGWFFKLTGPDEPVGKYEAAFIGFIKSIRFTEADASKPEWDLPEGWRQKSGSGMRYATINVGSADALELTVIPLPDENPHSDEYILANINRWRGQLGLPAIDNDQLADETQKVPLEGTTATIVSLSGRSSAAGSSRPPFAAGRKPPGEPPRSEEAASDNLTFKKPAEWETAASDQFSRHAFTATDGAKSVRITVTPFGFSGVGLDAQVNRWRRQVGLPSLSEHELTQQLQQIDVGGVPGSFVELVGSGESILGVIVEMQDKTWFFKLKGDAQVAARENERFQAFVKSVKFNSGEGAGDVQ